MPPPLRMPGPLTDGPRRATRDRYSSPGERAHASPSLRTYCSNRSVYDRTSSRSFGSSSESVAVRCCRFVSMTLLCTYALSSSCVFPFIAVGMCDSSMRRFPSLKSDRRDERSVRIHERCDNVQHQHSHDDSRKPQLNHLAAPDAMSACGGLCAATSGREIISVRRRTIRGDKSRPPARLHIHYIAISLRDINVTT